MDLSRCFFNVRGDFVQEVEYALINLPDDVITGILKNMLSTTQIEKPIFVEYLIDKEPSVRLSVNLLPRDVGRIEFNPPQGAINIDDHNPLTTVFSYRGANYVLAKHLTNNPSSRLNF